MKSYYSIEQYKDLVHSKHDIAAIHLSIRKWQEQIDQNKFTDLFASQADLKNIKQYYVNQGGNFFLAIDNDTNEVVGFVGLKRVGDVGEVKRLAVLPNHHQRGIAQRLMTELITWSKLHDIQELMLTTCISEKAQFLYAKLGFKKTNLLSLQYGDPRFQDMEMRMLLT